jgi:hypothetical protein
MSPPFGAAIALLNQLAASHHESERCRKKGLGYASPRSGPAGRQVQSRRGQRTLFVDRLDRFVLTVRSIPRAIAFYQEVLGTEAATFGPVASRSPTSWLPTTPRRIWR